jgi:hypothetical protein
MLPDVMDLADQAEATEELFRSAVVREVRARAALPIAPSDECLDCGAPTVGGARWCDAACRDNYERRQARQGAE